MKVLIVDDSKLARLITVKILESRFNAEDIYQAENGQEALVLAQKINPNFVFLDLTMPVMDGYTVLPLLLENNPRVKVIVITADIQKLATQKVLEAGAEVCIKKPISHDKLDTVLDKLMSEEDE